MRILIVGAGVVGFQLANELSKEGHDISIIDSNPAKIKKINEKLDVLAFLGNGCQPSVLKKAGIETSEMVIAASSVDEINIIICTLANKFKVKKKIARIRNLEYTGCEKILNLKDLFVDTAINPDEIIIDFIGKIMETPGTMNVAEFAEGKIQLRGFDISKDAPIVGKKLSELSGLYSLDSFLITGISRNGEMLIPKGEDQVQIGDHLYVLVAEDLLPLILPMLTKHVDAIQKVVIYGANTVGINVAKILEEKFETVTLIEPNTEKAEFAASILNKTTVLYGEATDQDLLKDANIASADFFMALSDDDESNLLSSLLSKKQGAKKVVIITDEPDYLPILDSIEMDIVINPRLLTVGAILQYIRRGRIQSVVKLRENETEVIEMTPDPKSPVVGKKLSQIKFPPGSIIGAIIRNGEMIIPDGESIIEVGESVIVFALPQAIPKIEKLFGKRKLF
jgi:trk system potassium uptake protein TrkA